MNRGEGRKEGRKEGSWEVRTVGIMDEGWGVFSVVVWEGYVCVWMRLMSEWKWKKDGGEVREEA